MSRWFVFFLGCSAGLWAEVGGLQSLPKTENFGRDVAPNGGFESAVDRGPDNWRLGTKWYYQANPSEAQSGNASIAATDTGPDNWATTQFTPDRRIYRITCWIRTAGDPSGGGATKPSFLISLFDLAHGSTIIGGGAPLDLQADQDWTPYSVDYFHVPPLHFGDAIQVRLRARDIASTGTLYVDNVVIEPRLRELVIFPIYPNYRGMLWPDQGQTITWKAIVDPPSGKPEDYRVDVELVRAWDGQVAGVASASALAPLDKGYSTTDMSYDAAGLANGSYYLRGRLRARLDGSTVYTYPDYKIVKEPASVRREGWRAWVDKNNRVVFNGTPAFVWGTYMNTTNACNLFPEGARALSTDPDGYRKWAMGCEKQPGCSVSPCDASAPAVTPWNRQYGLSGSTMLGIWSLAKFNTSIYYSPMSAGNPGIRSGNCGVYDPSQDQVSPWITALQDSDIWHMHIVSAYHPTSASRPPWMNSCDLDGPGAVEKLVSLKPLGNNPGFLGLYVADEPSHTSSSEGLRVSFDKVKRFNDLGYGGVSFWVDLNPGKIWNQWNTVMDAHGVDPYPVGAGPLADDVAFGIASGKKHGRSYQWPRMVNDAVFASRPNWTVIQLWRQVGQWPALSDMKIQIVSALAAGSTGILWWTTGSGGGGLSTMGEKEYLDFQYASKTIGDLLPLLSQPLSDAVVASISEPAIKCSARQGPRGTLLACANTTLRDYSSVKITLTTSFSGVVLKPWEQSYLIADNNTTFTAAFNGLQHSVAPENSVHLFLIPPSLPPRGRAASYTPLAKR